MDTARMLKTIGARSEAEILVALTKMRGDIQNQLKVAVKRVFTCLEDIEVTDRKKIKTFKKLSKEQEFNILVERIQHKLKDYESEKIDDWSLGYTFLQNYDEMTFEQIVKVHEQLISVMETTTNLKQLLVWEKGRIYFTLKHSEQWRNKFVKNCKLLKVSVSTAQRCVDFFHIINAFPRLLVTGIEYTVIIQNFTKLSQHLAVHHELRDTLKSPLREIKLQAYGQDIELLNLPNESNDPPQNVETETKFWGFGYEEMDRMYDGRENEESDEDEEDGAGRSTET